MQIGGLQKTSLLDYPDKISAIVFTKGCNFRCGYCHNPELIAISQTSQDGLFDFLKMRVGKLDAVVITGGEPCIHQDLKDFILKIKDLGYLVKLDTNGSFPDRLKECIPYVDYVAMDIKAPLEKYNKITNTDILQEKIRESVSLIMNSGVDYEFRTTVVKSQLEYNDFTEIGKLIRGAKCYYLQKFVPTKTLDKKLMSETTYSNEEFQEIVDILKPYVAKVFVR